MRFELTKEFIDSLREAIEKKDKKATIALIGDLHAADIAEIYEELDIDEAKFVHLLLDVDKSADVLVAIEDDVRERFLKTIPSHVIAKIIKNKMDSDDAADIIGALPDKIQQEILTHIDDIEQAGDIVDLLSYDEDTAGGLMAKELVAVNENWNITKCIREMRKQAEEVGQVFFVYVVDDDDILKGTLSLKKLLLTSETTNIKTTYNHKVISVKVDTESEEVANIMDKYDLVALPVVDSIGRLVGRITIDDVVDVIREEAGKDYQMMSGIYEDIESTDNVIVQTRARMPWLIIAMFGGILSSRVIYQFTGELSFLPQMAMFIPMITGMGGNVGIQSSAIIIQGLANNSLGIESPFKKLSKEFLIALLNGTILSSIILVFNYFTSDSYVITISVSVALFSIILFATLFGTFVPLILDKFKIDPALATGPFITTVDDISGVFIYLAICKLLLGVLA